MELTQLNEQNDGTGQLNRFVVGHPDGDFLQSWDWGDWQEQLGRQVARLAIHDNGRMVLAAQVIRTALPKINRHYVYIPHGPLLDSSLDDAAKAETLNFFIAATGKKFSSALFTRIEPAQDYIQLLPQHSRIKKTRNIQAGKTLVLDLVKSSEELQAGMHPKTRYNIKVAQRHSVVVQSDLAVTPGHGLHLPEAVRLITDTAKRQNYKGYPAPYYKSLIDFFGTRHGDLSITIYKAFYEKTLLSSAIIVDFGHTRTYLFGGSSTLHRNTMAPYLLHWQAIIDAKEAGLKLYDFGGSETAGGKTDLGFNRFKLGFGTQQHNFPGAYDIIQKLLWYNVYAILRSINRKF